MMRMADCIFPTITLNYDGKLIPFVDSRSGIFVVLCKVFIIMQLLIGENYKCHINSNAILKVTKECFKMSYHISGYM